MTEKEEIPEINYLLTMEKCKICGFYLAIDKKLNKKTCIHPNCLLNKIKTNLITMFKNKPKLFD